MNNKPHLAAAASKASSTPPSRVQYIHHLKFPVADLDRSVTFYEKVFNAQELVKLTHKDANGNVYAKVLQIPGFQARWWSCG